jgi:Ca-activated chloride channel family protein
MKIAAGLVRATAALLLLVGHAGCSKRQPPSSSTTPTPETPPASASAPREANSPITVVLAFGSEKKNWLADAIQRFNDKSLRLPGGELVRVEGQAVGSGAAVEDLVDGTIKAHAWAPASTMYREVFSRAWLSHRGALGGKPEILDEGKSLVLSPVVLAMWKPMAKALGWPDKPVGCRQIGR